MKPHVTAIERAFEIARSGEVGDVSEIKRLLHQEGYDASQLQGRTIGDQLKALMQEFGASAKPT